MAWLNRGVLTLTQQDARGARQAFQICLDSIRSCPATANFAILLTELGMRQVQLMVRRGLNFPGHPSLTDVLNRTKSAPVKGTRSDRINRHESYTSRIDAQCC